MKKIFTNKYLGAALVILGVILQPVPTIAQNSATTTTEDFSSTSVSLASQTNVKWFKSDFISGDTIAVGDFVTGPGNIEVTVRPGESVTKMMTVTNRISDNRRFELTVEDMSGSADPGTAVVLLGDKQGPYTLKDYISFPNNVFDLALGERAQIPVTITMPESAQPGGYYGAVLVSTVQNNSDNNEALANSPIVARIGTLFFITVPGEADVSGQVNDFSTIPNKFMFSGGPINFGILFENTGSVYLNPYGEIRVTNIFNEEVGYVTLDPWFVLPKSLRLREFGWDRELLLGRYTVTAKINRGYEDVVDEKSIHIWVIPWQVLVTVFAVLLFLFMFVSFVTSRFELKRKS